MGSHDRLSLLLCSPFKLVVTSAHTRIPTNTLHQFENDFCPVPEIFGLQQQSFSGLSTHLDEATFSCCFIFHSNEESFVLKLSESHLKDPSQPRPCFCSDTGVLGMNYSGYLTKPKIIVRKCEIFLFAHLCFI